MADVRSRRRRRPADRRRLLQAQARRAGDRPDRAGVHRAAHAGRRELRQGAGAGILDPEDQGHRDPAAAHRAGAGGGRPLRRALSARSRRTTSAPIGPDYARGRRRRPTSTAARPRSTAAPTRSSATSSPRWCWASSPADFDRDREPHGFQLHRRTVAAARHARQLIWPTTTTSRHAARRSRRRPAGGRKCGRRSPRSSASWARRSPEDLGGLGGGAIETMVVMEEFGKALVVEPYLGTVVIGGGFLKRAAPRRRGRADRRDHRRRGDPRLRLGRAARPLSTGPT